MQRFLLVAVLVFAWSTTALAAAPNDFTYRELKLGDSYEQMVAKLGQPRVDIDKTVAGWLINYYIYHDTRIGITADKIVDMRISAKDYTAKNGVKIGATPHKILREYGKTSRQRSGGVIYYRYSNPANAAEQLLFDITAGYLQEIRITNLEN